MEPMLIHYSKGKLILYFIVAAMFIYGGVHFLAIDDPSELGRRLRSMPSPFIKALGIFNIAFGAFVSYVSLSSLFDKNPGLRLDNKGITIYSPLRSKEFIPWREVSDIKEHVIKSAYKDVKIICIILENPEQYIAKKSYFSRLLIQLFKSKQPSPISISPTAFNILPGVCHYYLLKYLSAEKNNA